jgi:eukaryotic-like serine/threonine-protein kinase
MTLYRLPASVAELREKLAQALDGRYRVHDLLGAGAMGVVFLADDLEVDRQVAIKVLPPDLAVDETVVARFRREATTAARLDHPGIVPIYGAESAGGLHYFVMQYVAGRSLEDVLQAESPVSIGFATRVLLEAAAALAHAHRHGVVHRDVKPANIMLDASGRVVLADFGISKVAHVSSGATTVQKLTETGGVVGTPHYMAPEHALGQAVDGRTDQYALAVVGYQMLSGQVPFDDSTTPAIIHLQINAAAPKLSTLRSDVPPHLAAAIARAMSKAPMHRFATMEDFAKAIEGPARTTWGGSSLSWAAGVVLVLAGLAGTVAWMGRTGKAAESPTVVAPAAAKRQTVRLTLVSSPSASVFVDGRRIGATPVTAPALTVGKDYQIRLERKGYRTKRETINITGTKPVRRSYTLQREGRARR